MTDYEIGDTIKIQAVTKDYASTTVDVDTITIEIYDENDEAILTATAMTNSATGTYYYEWDSTDNSEGYYYYYIKGTDGTAKFKSKGTFVLTDD